MRAPRHSERADVSELRLKRCEHGAKLQACGAAPFVLRSEIGGI
jgi:hypothetical protein